VRLAASYSHHYTLGAVVTPGLGADLELLGDDGLTYAQYPHVDYFFASASPPRLTFGVVGMEHLHQRYAEKRSSAVKIAVQFRGHHYALLSPFWRQDDVSAVVVDWSRMHCRNASNAALFDPMINSLLASFI